MGDETPVDGHGTRVDAHVKVLDERVVKRAKARGIDAMVYAPHFTRLPTIRERAAEFSDDDLLVVPGREVFAGTWRDRKHVLGVGLADPVPDFITLEGALRAFERQDAAVLVPHPGLATMSLGAADVERHADAVHAVETYNAKCLPYQNRRAGRITSESGHPAFGSSYAHLSWTVGEAWTAFDRRLTNEADLVAAFREGAPRTVARRSGVAHRVRGLVEFSHLGYENTWEKIDRVLLSGMAPTHPDHIAYEGEFDDVRVY
ncbi:MAG: PHP-associated domain-containing protein [Haloferacaceae archaeon]